MRLFKNDRGSATHRLRAASPAAAGELLEPRRLLAAAQPELIRDINATTDHLGAADVVTIGNVAYFAGRPTAGGGAELFKTDGTTAGTVLVKDINPGIGESRPALLTNVNGRLYFVAGDAGGDRELWTSDGTDAGTVRVKDVRVGASSNPANLTAVGGTLYFTADDGTGVKLWRADGLVGAPGAVPVTDATGGPAPLNPALLTDFNGALLFGAGFTSRSLYRFDPASRTFATIGTNYDVRSIAVLGNAAYFTTGTGASGTATRGDLYRTEGTSATTSLLKAITYAGSGFSSETTAAGGLTRSGSLLYFRAGDAVQGVYDLWRSDGTANGTLALTTGGGLSGSSAFTAVDGNKVLFVRSTTDFGAEPWVSSGTPGGTALLKDFTPGSAGTGGVGVGGVALGGSVYFAFNPRYGDAQLWRTNGTPNDPALVSELVGVGGYAAVIGSVNNLLLLNGGRFVDDGALYRSDGTDLGTFRIDANIPANGSGMWDYWPTLADGPGAFARAGGAMYFGAHDGIHGHEVWRTTGDAQGAVRVSNIAAGGEGSDPNNFLVTDSGSVYFVAADPRTGRELYRVLPNSSTPGLVADILPGVEGSGIADLAAVGGAVMFRARDTASGATVMWRFNEATSQLAKVTVLSGHSLVQTSKIVRAGDFWYVGGIARSSAGTNVTDDVLWRISPTTGQVTPVSQPSPSAPSVFEPEPLGAVGNVLLFSARDAAGGFELWKTAGTPGTMARVADLSPGTANTSFDSRATHEHGGLVYFAATPAGASDPGLWRTDGTEAGTFAIGAGELTYPASFTNAADGGMYFSAGNASAGGRSVFRTDGTAADTVRLTEPGSGATAMTPRGVHAAGDKVYFVTAVGSPITKFELWRTGSTPGSAERIAELQPRVPNGMLSGYYLFGEFALASDDQYLYFPMYNPATGLEPHRLALVDPVDPPPQVTKVFVKGSSWSGSFLDALPHSDPADRAFGYAIDPADQLNELPWANVNQVSIRFSEHVNVAADDLSIRGVRVAAYGGAVTANPFSYDPTTFTATWRLGRSIPADKILLDLNADPATGVTDAGGNALDGEWPAARATAPTPGFPSGDDSPGGAFRFRFNVLPGDVNRNGSVSALDLNVVKAAQGAAAGSSRYSIFKDVNGSGGVMASDVNLARGLQGSRLPAGEPTPLAGSNATTAIRAADLEPLIRRSVR